jgi:nitric oxide reductase NorD protein
MTISNPAALSQWLRLLWGRAPALQLDSEWPFITASVIHLPPCRLWQQHCAAAAHAMAHLVYSPAGFDGDQLVPVARSLLALLEDARVEALAMRELPGLARLWRACHEAAPDIGQGCEPLMQRLARALVDPDYLDSHPWIAKGRRLFYLDAAQTLLALLTPAQLRGAAMLLGHDLGQMRLPFNAKGYRTAPAYRDDSRWMWAADNLALAEPQPRPRALASVTQPERPESEQSGAVFPQPEWDRLINRLRPGWSWVTEQVTALPLPHATGSAFHHAADPSALGLSRRLLGPLRGLKQAATAARRSRDGEHFDLDALIAWRLASRLHLAADLRVYRSPHREGARAAVWLLIDQSASTAERLAPGGATVLQLAAQAALAAAQALQALRVPCAVAAFSSNGRQAVRLRVLKRVAEPVDAGLAARLQGLQSVGSTRLGAALRQATLRLGELRAGSRWVLLLSDGQAHDIDVHDPNYLVEDARHAVRSAARRDTRIVCIRWAGAGLLAEVEGSGGAARIFGPRRVVQLERLDHLPQAVRRLLS